MIIEPQNSLVDGQLYRTKQKAVYDKFSYGNNIFITSIILFLLKSFMVDANLAITMLIKRWRLTQKDVATSDACYRNNNMIAIIILRNCLSPYEKSTLFFNFNCTLTAHCLMSLFNPRMPIFKPQRSKNGLT